MTPIALHLLGAFAVTTAASPRGTALATDKVRGLLAYLTLEPALAHRRETLAALFWPEINHQLALGNLRQTVHRLRVGLDGIAPGSGDALLAVTRQTVQFDATGLTVDVIRFTTLLAESEQHAHPDLASCAPCLERLRQAVALYCGELLAGFGLGDAPPFEEWLLLRRELYHQQALLALQKLTDAHERRGDYKEAHRYASHQLELDPYREEAHRQLMRLLALRGLPGQALTQYDRCRQLLHDELGVPPADETVQLMTQIRAGKLDKVTRWQGDKVTQGPTSTLSPLHSVTLSPLHPVTLSSPHPVTLSPPHPVIPHNLPAHLTPLIGRETAVAELCARLQEQSLRMLTIVGAGGMGKTRLALEVGQAIFDFGFLILDSVSPDSNQKSKIKNQKFPDGIFFVSLAALTATAAVAPAICAVLGLNLPGDAQAALQQALRSKQLLLILDNFEHLLDAAPDLLALLQAAPGVSILATSRERLNVRGEHLYQISPLDFGQSSHPLTLSPPQSPVQTTMEPAMAADVAHAHKLASVELFRQSAQRAHADFTVDATNVATILRICRLVQGMPLGLELAAAWVGSLSLVEIADAISQSSDFLTSDWRDLPARQRSMRAVFEWSWRLLTPTEQGALSQLALFQGGFTRTAAQAVTGATLPILTRLVHKSLLQWMEATPPATGGRYALHELLRQFAAEKLAQTPATQAAARHVHSRFYLHYLAERTPRFVRRELREMGDEIQQELDNIRQAWAWAIEVGVPEVGIIEALEGAAYGWWQFCNWRCLLNELCQSMDAAIQGVRSWLSPALPDAPALSPVMADETQRRAGQRLLSTLLAIHANLLFAQGVDQAMAAEAKEAIALGQATGGVAGEAMGYFVLGRAYQELEQMADAIAAWQKTLALADAEAQRPAPSLMACDMAWLAHLWLRGAVMWREDYAGAHNHSRQAVQICQALGNQRGELNCLANLAWLDAIMGDFAAAQQSFTAGYALAHNLNYRWGEMANSSGLGEMQRLQGDYAQALSWFQRSLTLAAEYSQYNETFCLAQLTRLHSYLGDQTGAEAWRSRLFQLLAQSSLPKDCQLQALLAAAVKAYYGGEMQTSLTYAEELCQLIGPAEISFERATFLVILGHARVGNDQWTAAAGSYAEALGYYRKVGNHGAATEAQAGLAQVALAQGDPNGARRWVEEILPVLAEQPRAGFNSPFFTYLTCYRVLAATQDARAATLLEQGWQLLLEYAVAIPDPALRRSFLEGVPIHRELQRLHGAAG